MRVKIPGLCCLVLAAVLPAFGADEPPTLEGLWMVETEKAGILIKRCDEGFCGRIDWLGRPLDEAGEPRLDLENENPWLRGKPLLGLRILTVPDAEPDAKWRWNGGKIYDPENGKTYTCTVKLEGPDRLVIRTFVGVKLFGKNTTWTRLSEGGSANAASNREN